MKTWLTAAVCLGAWVGLTAHAGERARPLSQGDRLPALEAKLAARPATSLGVVVTDHGLGGVQVEWVAPQSAAAALGLVRNDRITAVGAQAVGDLKALTSVLKRHRIGANIAVQVVRAGKSFVLKGRLRPAPWVFSPVERSGTYHLGVVLVDFSDVAHNHAWRADHWQQALFSRNTYTDKDPSGLPVAGSMADFFAENSGGRFSLTGEVFDWVQLEASKSEIDALPALPFLGHSQFLAAALDKVRQRDGAGALERFDGLCFVAAGGRGMHGRVLWPHRSMFYYEGRVIDYYVMEAGGRSFAGIGTHCHEFGHMIGLPDKYGLGDRTGLGCFCLMAVGGRGAPVRSVELDAPRVSRRDAVRKILQKQTDALRKQLRDLMPKGPWAQAPVNKQVESANFPLMRRPLHLCADCKLRLGWVDPIVLDPKRAQRLVLEPVEGRVDQVAIVPLDSEGTEYYLLSYRSQTGFDSGLPGSGLLIWHVGDPLAPLKNFVPTRLIDLEKAHGNAGLDGAYRAPAQVFYPNGKRNAFTPRTKPSSLSVRPGTFEIWVREIELLDGNVHFSLGPPS